MGRRQILDPENGKFYTLRLTPSTAARKLDGAARNWPFFRPGWIRVGTQENKEVLCPDSSVKKSRARHGRDGAQIAHHLVNVKVPVILFDLPAKEGDKNGIVTKAIANLKSSSPRPWAWPKMPI